VSDVAAPDPVAVTKWDETGFVGAVTMANVSKDTCSVSGSSKVIPVLPDGSWLTLKQTPFDDTPSSVLNLESGERAVLRLRIDLPAEAEDAEGCPVPNMLWVALPGETKSLEIAPPENTGKLPPICGKSIAVSEWAAE
jgi:hypothetical protein